MVYVDTSVIMKLYIREELSREASDWLRKNDEAIPLTPFHDLEFTNAVNLKLFRKEMTAAEAGIVFEKFNEHELEGIYHRPSINWPDVFLRGVNLSKVHTPGIGSRSLDIVHVALALSMGANRFFTFDARQSRLALAGGLRVECDGIGTI